MTGSPREWVIAACAAKPGAAEPANVSLKSQRSQLAT